MTDARVIRTRAALDKAIIELASKVPLADVTVSELAAQAGINRVTFYKHFNSPSEALEAALDHDLAAVRAAWAHKVENDQVSSTEHLNKALSSVLEHVERLRPIYETAISAPHDGVVQNFLADRFTDIIRQYLAGRTNLNPPVPDIDLEMMACLFGHGLTGAIKAWVLSGTTDRSNFITTALASAPEWLTSET